MTTKVHNPKAEFLMSVCKKTDLAVEIGCMRTPEENPMEGWSTLYLALNCWKLWSVDVDEQALEIAKDVLINHEIHYKWAGVHETGDSFLASWNLGSIDLLYLDSSDDPMDTLTQAKLALPHMAQGSRIVIDDIQPIGANWFGKGTMAIPFLIQEGWKCLIEPTLWKDGNCWAMAKLWKDA